MDSCAAHGLWFDARELDQLLRWVRRGGEAATQRREEEERAQLDRHRELHREPWADPGAGESPADGADWLLDVLAGLLRRVLG